MGGPGHALAQPIRTPRKSTSSYKTEVINILRFIINVIILNSLDHKFGLRKSRNFDLYRLNFLDFAFNKFCKLDKDLSYQIKTFESY